MATKQEIVEDALIKYGALTTLEIQQLIFTTNPQKFIERIKKKYGFDSVETNMKYVKRIITTRRGEKLKVNCNYAQYIWKGKKNVNE